jgi:Ni/Fe-hydrogenase subunit HybB-like protein
VSVHSIVSLDFSEAGLPGWHSTIFPPFFVAGAIFSGFALVVTLIVPARRVFKLYNVITPRHLDMMGKLMLVTSWIITYSYMCELFLAWWSGNRYELFEQLVERPFGFYAVAFWILITCNCVITQLLWSKRIRRSAWALFIIAAFVNVGMWLERFEIIVVSLTRDFLPSSWHQYMPTYVDICILAGTFCFFGLLFLTFLRLVPFVPVSELKELKREERDPATQHADPGVA